MKLMRFLLRSSRRIVILSAIAGAAGGALGIALIAVIQRELARGPSTGANLAWAFVALCLASASARAIAQIAMVKVGQGAIEKLGLHLVRHTLVLPLRSFETMDSSALLSALTDDIALIAGAMVGLPHLCINIPIVIACLIYTGWLAPRERRPRPGVRHGRDCRLRDRVDARHEIAAASSRSTGPAGRPFPDSDRRISRAQTPQRATAGVRCTVTRADHGSGRSEMVKGLAHFAVAEGWGQLAFFGFIGFLLFAAPSIEPISRSTLVSAVLVVLYLMTPLDIILTWVPVLARAQVSLQRVEALVPTLARNGDSAENLSMQVEPLELRHSICLDAVTFTYRDGNDEAGFLLGPIELTLRSGELVILAGGNGSGKTTLVKLLAGLYRPESGAVRLDGHPIGDLDRNAYRQLFSIVFADGHLFRDLHGLNADGIATLACEGLNRLGLAPVVTVNGSTFSTLDLSQGQRRRLALLGALLEDRPICIFDECAANQDPAFKQMFYQELLPELRAAGKALLVISHDENHFDIADRVIRLQDGRVFEESPQQIGSAWA